MAEHKKAEKDPEQAKREAIYKERIAREQPKPTNGSYGAEKAKQRV